LSSTARRPRNRSTDPAEPGGVRALVGRVKTLTGRAMELYPVRLVQAYGESQAGNYAAGLAFNMFMSMFPLMLGLLAVVGLVLRNPAQLAPVESALLSFFPPDAHDAVQRTLGQVRDGAGVLGIFGVLGLLWSGGSVFASMEFALGQMFGAGQRDLLRQRAMALLMTLLFVVVIVLSVVANAVLGLVGVGRLPLAGPLVGVVVWVAFMVVIYRVVPNRTFTAVRQVWPGALLAGVLMEILTLLWPLYGRLSHGFNTYGATFALFFVLATWLSLLSQLILLGAIANRMRLGRPRKPGMVATPRDDTVETPGSRAAEDHS
jgi:membrane protein